MRRLMTSVGALALLQLAPSLALANTESVVGYNARSSGMAFTGTAFLDSAATMHENAANLTDIERLSIDVSFNPEIVKLTAPAAGSTVGGTQFTKLDGPFVMSPLGFVGVAYKGHSRFTIGAAAMLMDAGGVKYNNAPVSLVAPFVTQPVSGSATAFVLSYEVRIPVAIKVTDWLSVSGGYRMTFANQVVNFKSNGITFIDQKLAGHNYAGAMAGVTIKPMKQLQFGLSYRSRTDVQLGGNLVAFDPVRREPVTSAATPFRYSAPHHFTVGTAVKLMDSRLLLAGDFKYWMYSDAYAGQRSHHDAMSGHVGAEYFINKYVPIRAGYFVGRSAIDSDKATGLTTSPKVQMGGTLGAGAHFAMVDVDASVSYGEAGGQVTNNTIPGKYHLRLVGFGLSASFKL